MIKQTIKVFQEIVTRLINPNFVVSSGGKSVRIVTKALNALEQKFGTLTAERIADYCVSSAYVFKQRQTFTICQALGAKSIERFNSDKGLRYYEDKWLAEANIVRNDLVRLIVDKQSHPLSKFVYPLYEETTKRRVLNQEPGYYVCQVLTLGWTPFSSACSQCKYADKCQAETSKKHPELYRLRIEYDNE